MKDRYLQGPVLSDPEIEYEEDLPFIEDFPCAWITKCKCGKKVHLEARESGVVPGERQTCNFCGRKYQIEITVWVNIVFDMEDERDKKRLEENDW